MNGGAADLQMYDIDEAAQLLKVKPHWLQTKVTAEEVPHHRVGRFVRFTADDLREIRDAGAVRPATERRKKKAGDRALRSA